MNEIHFIGRNNELMWGMPCDLRRFKAITSGGTVIMGRKTYESIGKPLPNRINMVVSRSENVHFLGCIHHRSLESALEEAQQRGDRIFVIGGGEIYREALKHTDCVFVTTVYDGGIIGDTTFPRLSEDAWEEVLQDPKQHHHGDEFPSSFKLYARKKEAGA